jgi:hypothetical protein
MAGVVFLPLVAGGGYLFLVGVLTILFARDSQAGIWRRARRRPRS